MVSSLSIAMFININIKLCISIAAPERGVRRRVCLRLPVGLCPRVRASACLCTSLPFLRSITKLLLVTD